ncbi:MAG: aminotransferase class I/II-fold pyridoxal phosphate-dependent enzyme [Bryobacteraceae bacterium]|nr:aminotransferase class I/II-fold pyridoxal phosphate-dependent enzyme [Bryobacteraceae bacterium]
MIDLRSDTVTRPTPAMRRAMAEADVGDDVYGEDPTVNLLERRAAEIFGKEAALFVATGTMGNTVAVKAHTTHGQEVICEARSHVFNYELAMIAWFSGCVARPVEGADGILHWEQIEPFVRPLGPHWAPTGLISLENTHNMRGGAVTPKKVIDDICDRAHERKLPVHLDGARVFNAATALGLRVAELCDKVDTVMFCLSKGLGAPAGSMVAGPAETIDRARLYRKRLGGGMRQAGVLAAPGLIALEEMSKRLAIDHENARFLAEGLSRIPGIAIRPESVRTNIVIFNVSGTGMTSYELSGSLKSRGVLANGVNPAHMRMVTHFDVDRASCERALQVMEEVVCRTAAAVRA